MRRTLSLLSLTLLGLATFAHANEVTLQEVQVPQSVIEWVDLQTSSENQPDVVFITRTMFGGGLIELTSKEGDQTLAPYGGFTFEAGAQFFNALEVGGFIEFNDISVLVLSISAGIYSSLDLGDLIYVKGRFYTIPAALSFQTFSYLDGIAGGAIGFKLSSGSRVEFSYERNLNLGNPGAFTDSLTRVQFLGVRFQKDI